MYGRWGRAWSGVRLLSTAALAAAAACARSQSDARLARDSTDSSGLTQSRAAQLRAPADSPTAATPTPAPPAQKRSTIVFAGTSLTAGLGLPPDSAYPMLIQRKIDSAGLPFDVVNAGVSGETSAGLLDRLNWLLRGTFDVFVLETGANDGLRGIPTSTLRTNLETAIDRIKAAHPDAAILLVQMEALPNLGAKYTSSFHDVYPTVAREKSVTLLPFLLDGVAGRRDLNQGDGVHPNLVGERIVADNVWRGLEPILERRAEQKAR